MITVIKTPAWSINGPTKNHTQTTAYLTVSFNRLAGARPTAQQIERKKTDCLALIQSPAVLKEALAAVPSQNPNATLNDEAVEELSARLTATFPGGGEIMELKLTGGQENEDPALLQAIIDSFIKAMAPPADSRSRLSAPPTPDSSPEYQEALERSRKSGKPVLINFLAPNSTPSRRFDAEIAADPKVAEFIAQHFEAVTIDVHDQLAFAKAWNIDRVPMTIVLGEHGTIRFSPADSPEHFLTQLSKCHKEITAPRESSAATVQTPEPGALDQYLATAVPQQPAAMTLKPGDEVTVKVAGAFPEAPIQDLFPIEPEGTIALGPLYGRVAIAGKTVSEAETAVKEHLGKTLTDVAVQLTFFRSRRATAPPVDEELAPAPATFLYDGKTFEQWRDLWKLELKPERRIEAINAMAAFGRAGRGQETADAILEVADEYGEFKSSNEAERKVIAAIDEAVSRMPAEQWMPQVLERIRSSEDWRKDVWRRRAVSFISQTRDARPEARALAAKFAEDEKLLGPVAYYLLKNDQELSDPLTVEFVREAWKSDGERGDLLNLLGFRRLDLVPEQLDDVLRRADARRYLASLVAHNPERTKEAVATLLAASKERENVDDRIGALRAIKTLGDSLNGPGNHELNKQVSEQLLEIINSGPDELLPAAIAAYGRLANNTPPQDVPVKLVEWKKVTDERANHLRKFAQTYDEFNAE